MTQYCPQCGSPTGPLGTCERCAPSQPQMQMQTQAQAQTAYAPMPFYAAPPASRFSGQWNWGAFLLNPFWLMNHGQVLLGIGLLILNFLPPLGLISFAAAIYYGIKGNDIAMRYRAFSDETQFVAVQTAWRNWGFAVVIASFVLSILLGIVFGILAVMFGHSVHTSY